jgi:hypothetical protein
MSPCSSRCACSAIWRIVLSFTFLSNILALRCYAKGVSTHGMLSRFLAWAAPDDLAQPIARLKKNNGLL